MTLTMFLWQWGLPSQSWPYVCRSCLAQPVKANGQKGSPWDQAAHPSKAVPYSPSEGKGRALNCSLHLERHFMQKKCWWNMNRAVVNERLHNAEQSPEPRIISWTFLWEVLSRVFLRKPVFHCDSASEYFWNYTANIYLYVYSPEMLQAQQNLSCPYILSYYLKAGMHANAL